jgi:predicted Zn-dependent peptidase
MPRTVLTGYMKRHYARQRRGRRRRQAGARADPGPGAAHFADLPARCRRLETGDYKGGEFREDRDLDQVHIVLGFPSVGYGDPDYYPTLLLSTLLGGGMSSRLFQEIREKRGLVYSIYSFAAPYMDGGLFGIYAGTGESEAEELMPVTLEELRKVQTDGHRGRTGRRARR